MSEPIRVEHQGPWLPATQQRPAKLNALPFAMYHPLRATVHTASADARIRVCCRFVASLVAGRCPPPNDLSVTTDVER